MSLLAKTLFWVESPISGEVKVVEQNGWRRLLVGGLVQSVSLNYPNLQDKVWAKMLDFPWPLPEAAAVLVLGLGGGTSLKLIVQRHRPSRLEVVEVDPVIIGVARRFFNLETNDRLKIINADAGGFMKRHRSGGCDLIVVDLYLGSRYPFKPKETGFYADLMTSLRPGGLISLNRVFMDSEAAERTEFLHLLRGLWGEVVERKIDGPSSSKNYLYFTRRQ